MLIITIYYQKCYLLQSIINVIVVIQFLSSGFQEGPLNAIKNNWNNLSKMGDFIGGSTIKVEAIFLTFG